MKRTLARWVAAAALLASAGSALSAAQTSRFRDMSDKELLDSLVTVLKDEAKGGINIENTENSESENSLAQRRNVNYKERCVGDDSDENKGIINAIETHFPFPASNATRTVIMQFLEIRAEEGRFGMYTKHVGRRSRERKIYRDLLQALGLYRKLGGGYAYTPRPPRLPFDPARVSVKIKLALRWLKKYTSPWSEVREKWLETIEYRFYKLKDKSIDAYFKDYPCLRASRGYTLIDIDFDYMHGDKDLASVEDTLPEARDKLLENLEVEGGRDEYVKALMELAKLNRTRRDLYESGMRKELLNRITALLLPYLLPEKKITIPPEDADPKKKKNKPGDTPTTNAPAAPDNSTDPKDPDTHIEITMDEVRDSFITHVRGPRGLARCIAKHRTGCAKLGIFKKPFIVLAGKSIINKTAIYVVINKDVKYQVLSITRAIDIVFKMTWAIPFLSYTRQCYETWLFIQIAFYQWYTPELVFHPTVIRLTNVVWGPDWIPV